MNAGYPEHLVKREERREKYGSEDWIKARLALDDRDTTEDYLIEQGDPEQLVGVMI